MDSARLATHPHNHYVQFYQSDDDLIESLRVYLGQGMEAGHAGVVIATEAHRLALEESFRRTRFDVNAAARAGHYVALDAAETLAQFMRGGMPDETLFVQVLGGLLARLGSRHGGVRAFGEMVALLWLEGNPEAARQLERLWNNLSIWHRFSLFCAYPSSPFFSSATEEQYHGICDEHSHVIPAGHGLQDAL